MRRFDFPFFRRDSYAALPWIVAFMVFLTVLFLSLAINLQQMTSRWQDDEAERITLHIPSDAASTQSSANQLALELKDFRGITQIKSYTHEEVQELLAPWLGDAALKEGEAEADPLPLPQLLELSFNPDELNKTALIAKIRELAPEAEITEHQQWLEDFSRLLRSTKWLSHAIVSLILLLTLVIIIMSTQTELSLHQNTVELLRSLGATHLYIAHQFQLSALWMAGKGTLAGLGLSVLVLWLFHHLSQQLQAPFLPLMQFSGAHWVMMLLVGISTVLLGMLTARLTVMQRLRELD